MDNQELGELIRMAEAMNVVELRLEWQDRRLHIRRDPLMPGAGTTAPIPQVGEASDAKGGPQPVLSTAVGYFHLDGPPGISGELSVGARLVAGQRIGFVETMGVLTEVVAPFDGELCELPVGEGQGVEYGHPLAYLRPLEPGA